MQQQLEKRLKDIRPGALFTTRSGTMAVKTEYYYDSGQCQCFLLESGEAAHFTEGNMTPVREVELEGQALRAEPEHEHTFALVASSHTILRMCPTCGTTWLFNFTRERWDTIKEEAEPLDSNA
jgi:hypothetical protein